MSELDDEMFGESNGRTRKTRREKRDEKHRRERLQVNEIIEETGSSGTEASINRHELDIASDDLKVLQATDATLRDVRIGVKAREAGQGVGLEMVCSTDGGFQPVALMQWSN